MRTLLPIIVCAACALVSGCATTQVSTDIPAGAKVDGQAPVAVITAENYGYYLFGYFPIVAGDPQERNHNTLSLFSNTVTLENNTKMMDAEAANLGAPALASISSDETWTGSFSFWIVWKHVLRSTSVAVKQ